MADFPQQAGRTIRAVAKRPVFHKEIGEFFRALRAAHGWGLRQAGRIAEDKGLSLLNFNTLGTLERGATKNPEPELLRELAALYKVPFPDLVGRFLTARYQLHISARDLPDHGDGVKDVTSRSLTTQGGSPHDIVTARALRDVTAAYQTFFRAVQDVSSQLDRLVSNTESPAGASATHSGTPRRRRRR